MKRYLFTLVLLICTTLHFSAQSNQLSQEDIEAIESGLIKRIIIKGEKPHQYDILDRMDHYNVPGISIAIQKEGTLVYAKGYGIANTKTGQKVEINTLFQAGSISKPVAALAALKLSEQGKVDLDTDVNSYLKSWKLPENTFTEKEKVTLRRLLTHTAGTTVHGFPGYTQKDDFPPINDVLNGKGNTSEIIVDTEPGSNWRYSGGGYTVIEKTVEDVTGISFESYMDEEILRPMGLLNSTYQQPLKGKWTENASAAYDADGTLIEGLWHNYPEHAAAGLWTTPSELITYCKEVQEVLAGKREGVLKKETIKAMLTKHQNDWGLGPALEWDGDSLRFQHGGKNAGFTNNMIAFAHRGNAVVIMTNADKGGALIGEILRSISNHYQWGIANAREIEKADLTKAELKKPIGTFEYVEDPSYIITISEKDGALIVYDKTEKRKYEMIATDALSFIDTESGDELSFEMDNGGSIIAFSWNSRFQFSRIK